MGQELDGNGKALAVLSSQMLSLSAQIERMCREWGVDHDQIRVNTTRLSMVEARPIVLCPKHDQLVEQIQQLQIQVARSSMTGGASGGLVVSIVAGVIFGVGKAAGWW